MSKHLKSNEKIAMAQLIGNQWAAAGSTPRGGLPREDFIPPAPTPCSISASEACQ